MKKDRAEGQLHRGGYAAVFAALAAALLVGALLCTALGSVSIAPGKITEILLGGGSGAERNILTQIRLPRMCMTVLLGGALFRKSYRGALCAWHLVRSQIGRLRGAPVRCGR